jgi:two-component system response regulator AtoC
MSVSTENVDGIVGGPRRPVPGGCRDWIDVRFNVHSSVELDRGPIVVGDPAMAALMETLRRVAAAPINVLVLGETGAGKDVVASMLHALSARANKPFVHLNCASLPEALLESELLGHDRGASTAPDGTKPGLLETAVGGTVFLDEIGDLPMALQAKLLRVTEAHEGVWLGATRALELDLRFIAATNRDLSGEVAAGRFRQDLYYRLNAITVIVPPLRERPSDIVPLARLFIENASRRFGRTAAELSEPAIALLKQHVWPGNVRELRNTIECAVILCAGSVIEPAHLTALATSFSLSEATPTSAAVSKPEPLTLEGARIERALVENGWNQSRAAKALGMPRRTLVRRIARLGFPRPRSRGPAVSAPGA